MAVSSARFDTGFDRCASQPAALASPTSRALAPAVRAMIGVGGRRCACSNARMARVASSPSMTGICTSMSTRSKGATANRSTASAPLPTNVTVCGESSRKAWTTMRLVATSSATRIRSGRLAVTTGCSLAVPPARRSPLASTAVNVNVLPRPGSLATVSCPPIIRTRRRQMPRPRPVPPKRLVVDESACVKSSKMRPS